MITEPSVYLVTKPSVDWGQVAAFLADEGVPGIPDSIRSGDDESAAITEISARLCYMSYGRGRRDISDFIDNLLRSKDGSVFEHVNYGFIFTGVSRSLTHELVRHRAGFAYSQRSQRYVSEDAARFVVPPDLLNEDMQIARDVFDVQIYGASLAYRDLVQELSDLSGQGTAKRKMIRQAARSVLPNATETKIFVTANVRAWRHFISMRGGVLADAEIRRLAVIVAEMLKEESPLLFGDLTIEDTENGRIAWFMNYKV